MTFTNAATAYPNGTYLSNGKFYDNGVLQKHQNWWHDMPDVTPPAK
jgi:hypothetical protein